MILECTPESLINSFIMMASLKLMPSGVSGEAYVLPYENRSKGICEAQFQLGYQGLVTLFYRAGVDAIYADIVREHDTIKILNGNLKFSNPILGNTVVVITSRTTNKIIVLMIGTIISLRFVLIDYCSPSFFSSLLIDFQTDFEGSSFS